MFVGLSYLFLSLAALAFWRLEPSCASGACSAVAQIGYFLGRPWWLWGALFYAAAGALCLGLPKNRLTGIFLTAGALFHAGLIAYGYAATGGICSTCWKFAAVGALLATLYWFTPKKGATREKRLVAAGPALLAVAAAAILVTSPAVTEPGYAHDSAADNPALEDCQLCASTKERGENETIPGGRSAEVSFAPQEKANVKAREAAPESAEENSGGRYLHVYAPDGKEARLDLKERPALFFAVWCPHCAEALRNAAGLEPEKRPYLVVAYLREGDAEKAKEKLAENGLAGETYYLAQFLPSGGQGVPALVWWDGGLRNAVGTEAVAKKLRARR